MSPENRPERKKPSKGWARHVRQEKAQQRHEASMRITTPQERIERFALPSWEQIQGRIEQQTYNDPSLYSLTFRYRSFLREYYDARYQMASNQGKNLYEEFGKKYFHDPQNLNLTRRLDQPMGIIRKGLTPKR